MHSPRRHASPTSKYRFSVRHEKQLIARTWFSTVSLLSKFTPRMQRLRLARMENPDKTKSPWGGFTVVDLRTTKILVFLIGFSLPAVGEELSTYDLTVPPAPIDLNLNETTDPRFKFIERIYSKYIFIQIKLIN